MRDGQSPGGRCRPPPIRRFFVVLAMVNPLRCARMVIMMVRCGFLSPRAAQGIVAGPLTVAGVCMLDPFMDDRSDGDSGRKRVAGTAAPCARIVARHTEDVWCQSGESTQPQSGGHEDVVRDTIFVRRSWNRAAGDGMVVPTVQNPFWRHRA